MNIKFVEAGINQFNEVISFVFSFYEIKTENSLSRSLENCVKELLLNPDYGKIWLIQIDGDFIGYIIIAYGFSLEYNGRDALIDEFFIKDSYRNKGIGKTTLKFIEENLKKNGVKALHLEVKGKHKKAITLYLREGFVEHKNIFMSKLIT
jgi:GNAT superfamily N-acetyltransferase